LELLQTKSVKYRHIWIYQLSASFMQWRKTNICNTSDSY